MKYTNLQKTLDSISDEFLQEYKKKLGDSNISKNISIDIKNVSGEYTIILELEDYWKYIENGRKPGSKPPPLTDMIKWVKKNNLPLNKNGKLYTVEQLAFVIARSISKKGLPAKHTLQKSIDTISNIEERIAMSLADDFEVSLSETINKIK